MTVSAYMRMLIGFGLANLIIVVVAAAVLFNCPTTPPLMQGVLLPQGKALPDFRRFLG